ncbi:ABC transporter ATP-binding protein [Clostridium cellulovorans]|uniref:ABC transporter related n=1 Tax=Clostridium cellulovorans (strain ATCC 35296 / DSM 3052 / OCM 3 / 743B) TaxID=573061 RepID=D9SLR1_CLOC7|nr:ATP-binding cassette domain-containing protein [Clostridium cellulovorans]ADL53698.1 ABC transporter related [Clostridium cellulovorans 743B]
MLKITRLSKGFNKGTVNEKNLFKDFNLEVKPGEFITIIGSDGAGKSTLLNIIAGAISPDQGEIVINKREIRKLAEYKSAKYIGRVFKDPYKGVSPNMTILENLSIAYNKRKVVNLTSGVSKRNIEYFKKVLSGVGLGLEDKLDTKVEMLSGGQRQALSLIMVVMSKPKLLLLDEHTAALDLKTSQTISEVTDKIVNENKITTMMVTHNLNHAINMGDRLIMMHQGQVVLDVHGEEKNRLTIPKLLKFFDDLKSEEDFNDTGAIS